MLMLTLVCLYVDVDIGIWVSDVKTASYTREWVTRRDLGKYNGPEDHILLSSLSIPLLHQPLGE